MRIQWGIVRVKEKRKAEVIENNEYLYDGVQKKTYETNISLDFCGLEHCLPGHKYGPHVRNDYVIHVVVQGKGVLEYGSRQWMIGRGQMFILFPGDVTSYFADKEDPWYYCWIGFRGDSAPKIVENIGFNAQTPVLALRSTDRIEGLIKKMVSTRELNIEEQLMRSAWLMEILSDMIRNGEQRTESSSQHMFSYSEYAVRYINNHFSEKLRIQQLADHIGISRSYLVKLMKQQTGMSPQEYLIETRMRRASELLSKSNDPIRDIAAECGYEDALAFSKVFKSRFGVNPSEYRAQNSGGNAGNQQEDLNQGRHSAE